MRKWIRRAGVIPMVLIIARVSTQLDWGIVFKASLTLLMILGVAISIATAYDSILNWNKD